MGDYVVLFFVIAMSAVSEYRRREREVHELNWGWGAVKRRLFSSLFWRSSPPFSHVVISSASTGVFRTGCGSLVGDGWDWGRSGDCCFDLLHACGLAQGSFDAWVLCCGLENLVGNRHLNFWMKRFLQLFPWL